MPLARTAAAWCQWRGPCTRGASPRARAGQWAWEEDCAGDGSSTDPHLLSHPVGFTPLGCLKQRGTGNGAKPHTLKAPRGLSGSAAVPGPRGGSGGCRNQTPAGAKCDPPVNLPLS